MIREASGRHEGEAAVECEGICGAWLHRRCAGLSKAFVCKSIDLFYCSYFKIGQLELEFHSVRDQVVSLADKLTSACDELTGLRRVSVQ